MKYRVQVIRRERSYQTVEVEANDRFHAAQKAKKIAKENSDSFCDTSYSGYDIGYIESI